MTSFFFVYLSFPRSTNLLKMGKHQKRGMAIAVHKVGKWRRGGGERRLWRVVACFRFADVGRSRLVVKVVGWAFCSAVAGLVFWGAARKRELAARTPKPSAKAAKNT